MSAQILRSMHSTQTLVCRSCGKEMKHEQIDQHTIDTTHSDFYLKPIAPPK